MRLIDADELQGEVYKRFTELRDCCLSMKQKISYDQERMIIANIIDSIPTVDPVKHGHWIRHGIYFECSYCHEGEEFENHGAEEPNYCLNCGAIMDEEVSDEVN